MKLFHTENEKEAVYVQMQDIMYLSNETNMQIPASIFMKVFTGITIVNDSNRFNWVKFDDEVEVKFFKELDFIIDYNQYKDLTDEQLEEEGNKVAEKANEIAEKWNKMTEDERKENSTLLEEHHNLGYTLKFLSEVYDVKHHKRTMPFPEWMKKTKKKPFFKKKYVE